MDNKNELIVEIALYQHCKIMNFSCATQVFGVTDDFESLWFAPEENKPTAEGVYILPKYNFINAQKTESPVILSGESDVVIPTMQNEIYIDFIKKTAKTTIWNDFFCLGRINLAAT